MSVSKADRPFRVARSRSGLGLFATAPIRKGAFILRYIGRRVSNDEADEIDNRYLFELNSFWSIDGASRRNLARYINHSCRPNAEVYFVGHTIKIRARRSIGPGEEIAYDYGRDHFDAFIRPKGCKCEKCRERRGRRR
jgi:SET domain-containing protein